MSSIPVVVNKMPCNGDYQTIISLITHVGGKTLTHITRITVSNMGSTTTLTVLKHSERYNKSYARTPAKTVS